MVTPPAQWEEIAERLRVARSYWLATADLTGTPHAAPVWGVVVAETLYLYSERRTAKARNARVNPHVVVHLESAEDARYLPTADPDFDVLWRLRPHKALLWQLADYENTQARWNAR